MTGGGGQKYCCFILGVMIGTTNVCQHMLLLIAFVRFFVSEKIHCQSAVCHLFVSCLTVVGQLFSRRVDVAALVPSPLSPLGPEDKPFK